MNTDDFFAALVWIDASDPDHHWPHHATPGAYDDGDVGVIEDDQTPFVPSETNWNALGYNPPEHCSNIFPEADDSEDVRDKPSWEEIESADRSRKLAERRELASSELIVNSLKMECKKRITSAYGADDWFDEIQRRLAGRHTAGQDTERDRLRAKHAALKSWVVDSSRSLEELESFDPSDDKHWKGET